MIIKEETERIERVWGYDGWFVGDNYGYGDCAGDCPVTADRAAGRMDEEKPRDKNIAVLGGGRSVCNIFPVSGTDFTLFCADQAIGAF